MAPDLSYVQLVLEAHPLVQIVMLFLLAISGVSWFIIFKKRMSLSQARTEANDFEDDFWSGVDLSSLYNRVGQHEEETTGIAAIFLSGFQEFLRLRAQPGVDPETVVGGSQRAMRAALTREIDDLESSLQMLATTGSTSPYIGLFGTVVGIMNSFIALGAVQQATLTQVAPGIAEALIATAMGLFAAIPAVIAYNRYVTEVDRLANRYETFIDEFSNILQRQSYSLHRGQPAGAHHGEQRELAIHQHG